MAWLGIGLGGLMPAAGPARERSFGRTMTAPAFLTAEWRYLVMLNFAVDPSLLKPSVPPGTELDFYNGETFLSVVGFRFLGTRVLGWSFPFHRDFEEVNLRFYVRRFVPGGWRRGVVFLREFVPRRAIAWIARICYGEPYRALPTRHKIEVRADSIRVEYGWKHKGRWESLRAAAKGIPGEPGNGSIEEFITEHYWGYTTRRGGCAEYQVEHPRWRVWRASESALDSDISSLYGNAFVESLRSIPRSAFIAEGSPVVVRRGFTHPETACPG